MEVGLDLMQRSCGRGTGRGRRRQMHDGPAALQQQVELFGLAEVADHLLDQRMVGDVAVSAYRDHRYPSFRQESGEVAANEPAGPENQNGISHRANLRTGGCKPGYSVVRNRPMYPIRRSLDDKRLLRIADWSRHPPGVPEHRHSFAVS